MGEVLRQRALAYPSLPSTYRDASYLGLAAAFLPFSLVGALILSRRPRNRVGWILCLTGLTAGLQYGADGYSALGYFAAPGSLPLATLGLWIGQWVFFLTLFLATTLLLLLFPDGRLPSPRWRPFLIVAVAVTIFFCAAWAFAGGPMQRTPLDNPLGAPPPLGDLLAAIRQAGWYAIVLMAVGSTASLVARYRASDGDAQAQIRWVAYAAVLVAATVVVTTALFPFIAGRTDEAAQRLQAASNVLTVVAFAGIPVAAGVAVLRYRLYDIDVLISRTFVYGSLTAILAGVYTASITMFRALFVTVTGEESDAALVITTLVLATSFTPLKRRLEDVVERRFKGAPEEASAEGDEAEPSLAPVPTGRGDPSDRLARLEAAQARLEAEALVLQDLRGEVRELSERLAQLEGGPPDRARPSDRPT